MDAYRAWFCHRCYAYEGMPSPAAAAASLILILWAFGLFYDKLVRDANIKPD